MAQKQSLQQVGLRWSSAVFFPFPPLLGGRQGGRERFVWEVWGGLGGVWGEAGGGQGGVWEVSAGLSRFDRLSSSLGT